MLSYHNYWYWHLILFCNLNYTAPINSSWSSHIRKKKKKKVYDMRHNKLLDKSNNTCGFLHEFNGLPILDTTNNFLMSASNLSDTDINAIRLHRRLAHCGIDRPINTLKNDPSLFQNGKLIKVPHHISCEACQSLTIRCIWDQLV